MKAAWQAQWQAKWQTQMARIDNLSLRERLFLMLSILVCCLALADTLWLSPAQTVHRQLQQRLEKQSAELQRLRTSVQLSAQPKAADQAALAELQATQSQLDALDQAVNARLPAAENTQPLLLVLQELLRSYPGLTLVRTAALPPEAAASAQNNANANANHTSLPAGLSRQGLTLTVAGAYPDLMRYVATLESALPQVRWGVMRLAVKQDLPELTLQLFLLTRVQP